ncbi:MarR family winged helix-turn-helix transcriptional regulator [Corynebacterium sp. HMSC29G08]|uniref:MarR family winged helix-turn-helix transcriptional regulator n=1 Tax=Corynebacterium sp. HMSC29G08 TaxID=1581069 RepID=UPI0008A5E395|nr:MarR family transcriptional regulator [Corynebacterium sp. HMSC29G08]OFT82639.1 hypothetical protein HMPREF3101_06850 [Corynebacterium sp. HMSC29G08]
MERFHWLEDRDADVWRTLWTFVSWVPTRLDEHLKRQEKMGLPDYMTLLSIALAEDNTTTMSKLAQATMMSPSRLSHVMDRLEQRGFTERNRSAKDRRSTFAQLTEEGVEFVVRSTPEVVAHIRETIFEQVTAKEAEQLKKIMAKIMSNTPKAPGE